MKGKKVAIIGVGKVGTAVGYLLRNKGYEIVSIAARHQESLEKAFPLTGGEPSLNISEASKRGDIVFITTGDDQIQSACEEIASGGGFRGGQKVIHMSGASSLSILNSAQAQGAEIYSIHPLQAFATVSGAIEQLPGTVFGVTTDERLRSWAFQFVEDLGGKPIFIEDSQKAIYHATACLVSNYLVTLMYLGEKMATHIGMPAEMALGAYWPLVTGTCRNIEKNRPVKALTGPIARGDVETIKNHRKKLADELPDVLMAYDLLGYHTVEVAREKGTLDEKKASKLLETFSQSFPFKSSGREE